MQEQQKQELNLYDRIVKYIKSTSAERIGVLSLACFFGVGIGSYATFNITKQLAEPKNAIVFEWGNDNLVDMVAYTNGFGELKSLEKNIYDKRNHNLKDKKDEYFL